MRFKWPWIRDKQPGSRAAEPSDPGAGRASDFRDPLMSAAHWAERISFLRETRADFREINTKPTPPGGNPYILRYSVLRQQLELILCLYSRGDDIAACLLEVPRLLEDLDGSAAMGPGHTPTSQLLYTKQYKNLIVALDAPNSAARDQALVKFIGGYYRGESPTYWYGNHQLEPDFTTHFGCWCLEVVPFVQTMDIDDAQLAKGKCT